MELPLKLGQLVADVRAQLGCCGCDFFDQLRAAIDQREYVVNIEAGQQVAPTPTLPGAELRRNERRGAAARISAPDSRVTVTAPEERRAR